MHAGDLPARLLYSPKIRAWWQDSDGTFKPGRAGLTLAVNPSQLLPVGSPIRPSARGF